MLSVPQTPAADGATVLLPTGFNLASFLAEVTDRRAAMDFTVAGVEAHRFRSLAREEVSALLGVALPEPWVVTSHQSELHHPGVWFKDAVVRALSKRLRGTCLHIAADLDAIKDARIHLPHLDDRGRLTRIALPITAARPGQSPHLTPPPTSEQLQAVLQAVDECPGRCGTFDLWARNAESALAESSSLADWLARARAPLNAMLGAESQNASWSQLAAGRSFIMFAADALLRARQMLDEHNAALAEHRRIHGVRNPARPVPPLHRQGERLESPFWLVRGDRPREPLFAEHTGRLVRLSTPAGFRMETPADHEGMTEHLLARASEGILVAPRALTLTMFLRTFVADVFVHGLGGARYDVLGDALTERWFGWRAAPFVAASATLRLDLPRCDAEPADLSWARWRAHHAWHNPQELAEAEPHDKQFAPLLERQREALRRVRHEPRLSRRRQQAYQELLAAKEAVRASLGRRARQPAREVHETADRLAHNRVADNREWFYPLYPWKKLEGLVEQARAWAGTDARLRATAGEHLGATSGDGS